MKTAAQYIADAKAALGDARMSDRELGERLGGFSQSYVAGAKTGKMTDPLAIRVAEVLRNAGIAVEVGEVLMVARMERERDPTVREHLAHWVSTVGKALSLASEVAVFDGGAGEWRKR